MKAQLSTVGLGFIGVTRPTVKEGERPLEIADWIREHHASSGELLEVLEATEQGSA